MTTSLAIVLANITQIPIVTKMSVVAQINIVTTASVTLINVMNVTVTTVVHMSLRFWYFTVLNVGLMREFERGRLFFLKCRKKC
jgi:hypothetical protein